MTSRRYLTLLIGAILLGVASVATMHVWLDHYGLFGEVRGAVRKVYRGERTTKYLLARRYVPQNFDALLLGGSISVNWNTKLIVSPRIYNASISGGNLHEQKLIADQVLDAGKLRWLVVCVHPYMTMTSGRKTEQMTPRDYWAAFGSVDSLFAQGTKSLVDMGLLSSRRNEFGYSDYRNSSRNARESMDTYIEERRREGKPHPTFRIAPGALDELRDLVGAARSHGANLAVIYPPVYKPRFDVERPDWEHYWRTIEAIFPPETRYLNFNAPAYDVERSRFENFQDGSHLSPAYADALVRQIGPLLRD